MPNPPRQALPRSYQRPSDLTLDRLTDPGFSVTSGTQGTHDASDDGDTWGAEVALDTKDTDLTKVTSDVLVRQGAADSSGTADAKTEPRDHVKLRRSLANEMRDAVWFLSEHGRPRVQLGELLDEAVHQWLSDTKKKHNDGEQFPHRGRLR